MSSEFPHNLASLWQQQPTPAVVRSPEAILREVREAERKWNDEWRAADRGYLFMFGVCIFPVIVDCLQSQPVDWVQVLLVVIWGWWGVLALWFQRRQRILDEAGDLSLVERFAKARKLLRDRKTMNRLQLIALPLVAVAVQRAIAMLAGSRTWSVAVAAATFAVLVWTAIYQQRKMSAHLAAKLAGVDAMASELERTGGDGR